MRSRFLTLGLVVLAFIVLPGRGNAQPTRTGFETIKEYLLNSAAKDFHDHQPPFPKRFRNVRIGHIGDLAASGTYRMCGEFLPTEGGDKAEWNSFVTIKTSGYEQYIGSNGYCSDKKIVWATDDLSSELKSRLDSLVATRKPEAGAATTPKTASGARNEKLRDIPFPGGVDLQFLIKELAREMDLNILFDVESFRAPRRTSIDLKNVTAAAALNYIFLQEGLFFEEAGPKTILVATRFRGTSIPQIGVGVTHLTEQLAQYFGVEAGILINNVRADSPAAKAGLKAGDVIVEIDGAAVKGAVGLFNAINEKNDGDVTLKIVRDRKARSISLTPQKGIE